MALLFACVLLALSVIWGVIWWSSLVVVLQGLLPVILFVVGAGTFVVAFAARRGKRDLECAKRDSPSRFEEQADSSDAMPDSPQ